MAGLKHLLGIAELTGDDILAILEQARRFREVLDRPIPIVPVLRGKTIVNLFFEPSTRTITSFNLAASRLSAQCLNFAVGGSAVKKGESILDTVANIEAMRVDGIVIRHSAAGVPHFLARHVSCFVVNAGDGCHEHPTQALLDAFTLIEHFGTLKGKRVLIVGDIAHSRVARSNILLLNKLGAQVAVCGPPTLLPAGIEEMGCEVFYHLDRILSEVDVVNMLRLQTERMTANFIPSLREYRRFYGLTRERLAKIKPEAVIMHPGPVNWGVEMDYDVREFSQTLIMNQVKNGVAVRMAVFYILALKRGILSEEAK
ncbi:aspartate carbamoyltransferase catalytic subunit [candidate division WOR-3 bacterium]|nr:aspartate carbamoyltransferase catalytic subunit [candidate division WOR-3 bacterium]